MWSKLWLTRLQKPIWAQTSLSINHVQTTNQFIQTSSECLLFLYVYWLSLLKINCSCCTLLELKFKSNNPQLKKTRIKDNCTKGERELLLLAICWKQKAQEAFNSLQTSAMSGLVNENANWVQQNPRICKFVHSQHF